MSIYRKLKSDAEMLLDSDSYQERARNLSLFRNQTIYEEFKYPHFDYETEILVIGGEDSSSESESKSLIENVIQCKSIEEFREIYPIVDVSIYAKAMNMGGPLKPFIWEVLRNHISRASSDAARMAKDILRREMQTGSVESLITMANINISIPHCIFSFILVIAISIYLVIN